MAVNRVTFTINSRQYTVVANESREYIESLCEHINEKVESVLRGGQNIMGERPIVLAALNICDEYFKAIEDRAVVEAQSESVNDKNSALKKAVDKLNDELQETRQQLADEKSGQVSIDEEAMKAEVKAAKDELADADNKIKFLEGNIKILESKIKELEERYEKREQEILDMIDEKD